MPATMTLTEAANHLGMRPGQFRRAVARKELPEPLIKSRPQRWSAIQLQWALEGRAGEGVRSSDRDPIMDHLDGLFDEVPK